MKKIKEKLAVWSKDRALVQVGLGVGGAILLLIVCLCISIIMRSNIQKQYTNARSQMQEQAFQGLINMTTLFDRVDDPNVDVQNKLIPELRAEYMGVKAINDALTQGFGPESAVLSPEQIAAFDAAFDEYSSAYRQGLATGLAQADMTACMEGVQIMIDARYAPEATPTEPVVIIDGKSGEIANATDDAQ